MVSSNPSRSSVSIFQLAINRMSFELLCNYCVVGMIPCPFTYVILLTSLFLRSKTPSFLHELILPKPALKLHFQRRPCQYLSFSRNQVVSPLLGVQALGYHSMQGSSERMKEARMEGLNILSLTALVDRLMQHWTCSFLQLLSLRAANRGAASSGIQV